MQGIDIYRNEVAKLSVLSREDEEALYPALVVGKKDAQHKLINANIRIAIKYANMYSRRYPQLEYEELLSESNLGLVEAVKSFNPSAGNRFSTYAVYWITKYLERHCVSNTFHVTVSTRIYYKAVHYHSWLAKQRVCLRTVTPELKKQAQKELGITNKSLHEIETYLIQHRNDSNQDSLEWVKDNFSFLDNEPKGSYDNESVESSIDSHRINKTVDEAFDNLKPLEAEVMSRLFGLKHEKGTTKQIAEEVGITSRRVKSTRLDALKKLKRQVLSSL
ncbi:RNA polymerase sigma factor RpoS [Vibrio thalassae]|uniref:RNA polymerase sigma factor RpoS n=1 Tax=Vibrio thalassae TaxID=1243014 RepID=A0A240EGB9_9VIBR|nr:sigma-70 family RNA polymerase sigma factor [Vibrio thalassae]SNX47737.1 RNA polymerase sigma factor RpoS [Vibrio thalassae]